MKTSETLPRPLGSAHIVPNHMLLLTPKRSLLIGAAVENLRAPTGGPEMSRCRVLLFKHVACSRFHLLCYSALVSNFSPCGSIFLLQLTWTEFTSMQKIFKVLVHQSTSFNELWSWEIMKVQEKKKKNLGPVLGKLFEKCNHLIHITNWIILLQ